MRSDALNDKLRSICLQIGLIGRFSYHSFRRTAIIETRRADSMERARQLASHTPGK